MAKNAVLFEELKKVVATVEANRGFNFKEGVAYKIVPGSVVDAKDKNGKDIKQIKISFNDVEKVIDIRNLLPFGLKGNDIASNKCNGVEATSLNDILEVVSDSEGFKVEFISKADGFGSIIDDESKYTDNDIIWGANRYFRRERSVQLVNFVKA